MSQFLNIIDDEQPTRDGSRSFANHRRSMLAAAISAALLLVASANEVRAQSSPALMADGLPRELEGAGITERLNQKAPLDIPFKDEHGRDVTLRDYLKPGKPIILTPVYYRCPMLCKLTLNGLVDALEEIEWTAGKEFTIVSFSINHNETPELAEVNKRAYLTQYRRDSVKDGWHFLTGTEASIAAMCDGIGFGFRPDGKGDYAHTSTIIFLTPDGTIARYMNEVNYQSRDVRFALVESSQGAIGSPMDKFLLLMCYHYDPLSNSYAASAKKIMRLGGALTLMLMAAGFSFLLWRGSHRRAPREFAPPGGAPG